MYLTYSEQFELIKTNKGILEYFNNNFMGYCIDVLNIVLSSDLSDEVLEYLFKYIQNPTVRYDKRLFPILKNNLISEQWLLKFYHFWTNDTNLSTEIENRNRFFEMTSLELKKLIKNLKNDINEIIAENQNLPILILNILLENKNITIIKNDMVLLENQLFDYLLSFNNKGISSKLFNQIIKNVIERKEKSFKLIKFIINNGSYLNIKNTLHNTITFKNDNSIFNQFILYILNHKNITVFNKEKLVKEIIIFSLKNHNLINENNLVFIKAKYIDIWNKYSNNIEDKKPTLKKFIF